MFRCDFCEEYRDKSECCANPTDDCGNICQECSYEYEERNNLGGNNDEIYS